MPAIHRMGDCNDGGGCITGIPQGTVFTNTLLVSVNGSIGTGHPPCEEPVPIHCAGAWQTSNGSTTVYVNSIPVNFLGNGDTCGHSRIGGSGDVFVE